MKFSGRFKSRLEVECRYRGFRFVYFKYSADSVNVRAGSVTTAVFLGNFEDAACELVTLARLKEKGPPR